MTKNVLSAVIICLFVLIAGCTIEDTTGDIVSEEVLFDESLFSNDSGDNGGAIDDSNGLDDLINDLEDDGASDNQDNMDDADDTSGADQGSEELTDQEKKVSKTIEVVEGELVELSPRAVDPDGDKIEFLFSAPLNKNGRWQTNEGDAGRYLVTVTADDGTAQTSQDVLIIVKPANKAPTLECPEELTINEGENVFIDCNIFDVDGSDSDITVVYSGWMKEPSYATTYDDAGEHTVVVSAEDAFGRESLAEVLITVKNVNRAPEFLKAPEDITVMEGDLITIDFEAEDPDNDELTITYSPEFDKKGTWQTKIDDAGTYNAFVAVSDGEFTTKEEFEVVVQLINTAPVLKEIPDIYVDEGETVKIKVDATDREGDDLTVSFDGWMNSDTKETTFEDAWHDGCDEKDCTAEYQVTVTVSDGFLKASQVVNVFVKDVNQLPGPWTWD